MSRRHDKTYNHGDVKHCDPDNFADLTIGFPSRYVYVLTRPDNPLTEEELAVLQEKYVTE